MRAEYRICENKWNKDILKSKLIDTISVGSEGCMYQVSHVNKIMEFKKKAQENGKNFSLVLPKIPQKFLTKAIKLLEDLNEEGKDYTLVVNDYGLLYYCKENGLLPERVCIGRGISRSFEDCLWYEHILRNETEINQKTMIQNNMYDEDKMAFLNAFNVNGVECNMLRNQSESYSNLSKLGYQVNVHYGYVSVAFSRACQTAKYFGVKSGTCSNICDKPIKIAMSKIWTRDIEMESRVQQVNEEIENFNPQFLLLGNVLYRENRNDLKNISFDCVDNLIFDSIFTSYDEIEAVLNNI